MTDSTQVKVCLNCGDILLAQAKRCPTCGKKEKDLLLIVRSDKEKILEIRSNVPNPKGGKLPKWQTNLELKSKIWNNSPEKKREVIAERKNKAEENGLACCPKCGSTSLSANKKGFGIGKAVVGGIAGVVAPLGILGLMGLTAGNIGSKKVRVTCLKCGYQFKAGK